MVVQHFLSPFFPELIFRINTAEQILYLTFDDGPTEITPWILGELKKHNAKATFFCVGRNVERNPALYSDILNNGHSVGNHTMHHLNGWRASSEKYVEDCEKCDVVLNHFLSDVRRQTSDMRMFRPPYGKMTPSQYSSLKKNHRIVMWDVLSKDYDAKISEEKCFNRVITKSKPGSVIVFHDSVKAEKNLRYVLPRVLEYFSERTFLFNSLQN